jgi:tetratricopeptide (TPR) repeat protein
LIEKVVGFAEQFTPIALIGAGGIGKTSAVLTVLHHDRIKKRFGEDRRFIRCDQLPASHTHLLRRLSKVIGAGIENPEDMTPLRPFLSSKEMLIVLDNAESILDLQGTNAQEIYAIVDELSQFSNICLCITSRISAIPPHCETLNVPTLSMDAACDTFYRIYKHGEQTGAINDILEQLDFHPLSITLLATVAQHNQWDTNRLTREWQRKRTEVLRTQHSGSLATTIELSLASPMFRELGPDARGLLGVIAFFPQGVDEENIEWLFPTISDGLNIFDKFCVLSLAYRSNGFITMLAPLRDYLRPKNPALSPLLGTTKERYFTRFSAYIYPNDPSFEESQWIRSEDVNVEHLLDVFTSIDANSEDVWDACARFMNHLYWHRPRLVMLGPKIEGLPDDHPSKAQCLWDLSWLPHSVGNQVERKRLLTHTLKLWRERGDDQRVAQTLSSLSDANRLVGHYKEGIQQAKEALEILERLGDTVEQAQCLINLARLFRWDKQLDAAEEAASRAVGLFSEKGDQLQICRGHRILGDIYQSKGETEKTIHHLEIALSVASSLNLAYQLFWAHFSLTEAFSGEGRLDDAQAHIERAKSYAVNDAYLLARASRSQAQLWDKQHRSEEAKSEALRALDVFEKFGAANQAEETRRLIEQIDRKAQGDGQSSFNGELPETMLLVAPINSFTFRQGHSA